MRRVIWHWIASWFATTKTVRDLLGRLRDRTDREAALEASVSAALTELDARATAYGNSSDELRSSLRNAEAVISQQSEALSEMRSEQKIMETELTNLSAAYERQLKRYDRETSIEVARITASQPSQVRDYE